MQDDDLSVFQMRRHGFGNIRMGGRRQNDHDDLHLSDRLADVGCDQCQFAESMRTAFGAFQFDAAALFDDLHMFGCAVDKVRP